MATKEYLDKTGLQRFWSGVKSKIAEKAKISLTGVDPGEGVALPAGEYIAVYGEPEKIGTSRIEDSAVTTAKIANNAVATDKVDWTTMKGSSNMPVAKSTVNCGQVTLDFYRIGNLVLCNQSVVTSSWPTGNRVSTGKTMPSGFRPHAGEAIVHGSSIDGQHWIEPYVVTVQSSGAILRSTGANLTGATRIDFNGAWITLDAWPS